jgi:hypothetical protein
MKKINYLFLFLLMGAFMFTETGCDKIDDVRLPVTDKDTTPVISTTAAKNIVMNYMKNTLGTIPGANINYDSAKDYLTPDLEAEFTTPMFIPASYCIQDGPENVKITESDYDEDHNWIDIVVQGQYGDEWMDMWDFVVVPVEGDKWMINEIKCFEH